MFYQAGSIGHCTHAPVPFSQSSAKSDYNTSCTELMAPENFRILNNGLLNKVMKR